MSTIEDDIAGEVARIAAVVSCPVTGDPRIAASARGVAVLVDPPTRDYVQREQTWQLVVLRNTSELGLDTTKALSAVVAELEESIIPILEAKPGARRLGAERPAVPAYFIRYTSS